jgi:ATP-dependent protease HslVU (ClpYQ) peptidase subunit
MTCIVGLVNKGRTYLGGDSAGVSGLDITVRKDKKVFSNGEFVMGFTSSFRMGQVLQYDFVPPEVDDDDDEDLMRYMVKKFIPEVRKVFKETGYSKIDSNREAGGCFLVGVRGRLFQVDSDFQVGENMSGFAAVGCGESYALGSLLTTDKADENLKPKWRLEMALLAASTFSGGVCEPFNFVHTNV